MSEKEEKQDKKESTFQLIITAFVIILLTLLSFIYSVSILRPFYIWIGTFSDQLELVLGFGLPGLVAMSLFYIINLVQRNIINRKKILIGIIIGIITSILWIIWMILEFTLYPGLGLR